MTTTRTSSDWCEVSLSDACVRTELTSPEKKPNETFLYVDVSSVSNETFCITDPKEMFGKDAPSRARKLIRRNDVIFATVRPALKRVALIPPKLDGQVCSTGFCVLRSKPELLDPLFLYFYLLTDRIQRTVEGLQDGATYPAIRDSDLLEQSIPLPTLYEQRAIARALDAVQKAKEARQRELALERERKGALMEYLFTHGTRGEPTKQTEIGEMPESWNVVPLADKYETQLGKMLSQKARKGKNRRPYMRNANVQWGRVDIKDVIEMDFSEPEQEKFRLYRNDLLVCEGGEIGRTAIWLDELPECYFQKAIHRLRPKSNAAMPHFLLYWMEWAFRLANIYKVQGARTTIAHLPQDKLEQLGIPFPEQEEQARIISVLNCCGSTIECLEKESLLLDELFRAMLDELMAGRLSALPLIEMQEVR